MDTATSASWPHNDRVNGIRARKSVPSVPASIRLRLSIVVVAGMLALSSCATPPGGAATPTPTPTLETPSPETTPEGAATPDVPSPTETIEVDAPYNGEVLIVTAEQNGSALEVTAMIPGVSEDNGTCVLHIDGVDVASVPSTAGNEVTYCGLMSGEFAAGSAPVEFDVQYDSPSTRARSAASTVEPVQ